MSIFTRDPATNRRKGTALSAVAGMTRRAWCQETGPPRSRRASGRNAPSSTARNSRILLHALPRKRGEWEKLPGRGRFCRVLGSGHAAKRVRGGRRAFPNPVCGVRTKALRGNSGASLVRFVQRCRRRELPKVTLSEPGLTPPATRLKRAGGEKLNCAESRRGIAGNVDWRWCRTGKRHRGRVGGCFSFLPPESGRKGAAGDCGQAGACCIPRCSARRSYQHDQSTEGHG